MQHQKAAKVLLCVCAIVSFELRPVLCTLSKSDRGKKTGGGGTVTTSKAASSVKQSTTAKAQLKPEDAALTAQDILKNYQKLDYSADKKFPNAVMGYVTPWNNRGYDLAKWQAQKFNLLSPVWLQINPTDDPSTPHQASCRIDGTHDVDRGWLSAVRSNNSAVKLVPRLLFDKWLPAQYMRFFADALEQERCAGEVINYLKRNEFDGGVIELWMNVMSISQGQAAKDLVQLVITWGEMFRIEGLLFVLPVPPSLGPNNNENGMFTTQHFKAIAPYVDLLNVMTYDYPDKKIGPIAPLDWVRKNVEHLLLAVPAFAPQLIMGINFYGREQKSAKSNLEAITGNRFIDILTQKNPAIVWQKNAAEHFVRDGAHVAYFPSLASIEARLNLAKDLHVNVGIWDCGQGLDYFYNLF